MRYGVYGLAVGMLCVLSGCVNRVAVAIQKYHEVAPQVQLGMERDEVLLVLKPSQVGLKLRDRKESEFYFDYDHDAKRFVELFFFRSRVNHDGILTDDEFTPYIFHDGVLTAIGWEALGGPKTQARPRPQQTIQIIR